MADEQLYLDYEGLATFKVELNGVDLIMATGDGNAYTATIPNVTALKRGMIITIIPDTTSTATIPTLNVNGLGAKNIKQRITTNTSLTVAAGNDSWMIANKPVPLLFDGTQWVTITGRASAQDLYGTVPLEKGGTGVTSLEDLIALLDLYSGYIGTTIDPTYVITDPSQQQQPNYAIYYRYGRVVVVSCGLNIKSTASKTYTEYHVATGFPPLYGNGSIWFSCYCEAESGVYGAGVRDGSLLIYAGKTVLPANGFVRIAGAYITEE